MPFKLKNHERSKYSLGSTAFESSSQYRWWVGKMCGIAGFLAGEKTGPRSPFDERLLIRMTERLSHRGPDGSGTVFCGEGQLKLSLNGVTTLNHEKAPVTRNIRIGLGHTRLSIIDHSERGCQPLANEDKTIFLVCNGEVYNFRKLRLELEQLGHTFSSHSDSEVILHLYEQYDMDGFSRLVGMYAFCLWDSRNNIFVLHRDRFGEKPLFYSLHKGAFVFASEIKAFQEIPGFSFEVAPEGVESYMAYGHVIPPFSWFKEIRKLSCGHFLVFDGRQVLTGPAWKPRYRKRVERPFEQCLSEFDEVFCRVIQESTIADDIECGVPISGGIDSAILSLYMKSEGRQFNKFTIYEGHTEKLRDEFVRAKMVHSLSPGRHMVLGLGNAADPIKTGVALVDEPVSSLVDISLRDGLYSKMAQLTKVGIIGGSGDHVFLNGNRFHAAIQEDLRSTKYRWLTKLFPQAVSSRVPVWSSVASRLFDHAAYIQRRHQSLCRPHMKLLKAFPLETRLDEVLAARIRELDPPDRIHSVLFMSLTVDRQYLQYLDDAIGMRYGLEIRDPFLHVGLLEFISSVPLRYLWPGLKDTQYDHRSPMTKYLIRKALERKSEGKIANVFRGEKMAWGGDKKDLLKGVYELSSPGKRFDMTKNEFLLEACHLNADGIVSAAHAKNGEQDDESQTEAVDKLRVLNLWIYAHPEFCSGVPSLPEMDLEVAPSG